MIPESELREAFCEIGRRVWQRGYVAANDGNFSFRLDEERVLCTPTLISKGFMKPSDLIVVDMEGKQLAGDLKPTSEIRIHLYIYQNRPDVYSAVHVHPPHATAFAVARRNLPSGVSPEVETVLGEVPLAPYELTGTWVFARSIEPWVKTHDAFLLASHGALTVGVDPFDAYYRMEILDQYCRMLLLSAQLGGWQSLSQSAMDGIFDLKKRVGLRDPRFGEAPTTVSFVPHPGPLEDSPKMGRLPS